MPRAVARGSSAIRLRERMPRAEPTRETSLAPGLHGILATVTADGSRPWELAASKIDGHNSALLLVTKHA